VALVEDLGSGDEQPIAARVRTLPRRARAAQRAGGPADVVVRQAGEVLQVPATRLGEVDAQDPPLIDEILRARLIGRSLSDRPRRRLRIIGPASRPTPGR